MIMKNAFLKCKNTQQQNQRTPSNKSNKIKQNYSDQSIRKNIFGKLVLSQITLIKHRIKRCIKLNKQKTVMKNNNANQK